MPIPIPAPPCGLSRQFRQAGAGSILRTRAGPSTRGPSPRFTMRPLQGRLFVALWSLPKLFLRFPAFSQQPCHHAVQFLGFLGPAAMKKGRVLHAGTGTAARSVHPADGPAPHGGVPAGQPRPLAVSRAAGRGIGRLHGVGAGFHSSPAPLWFTLPTMACPPSATVTRSTRTTCCPLER